MEPEHLWADHDAPGVIRTYLAEIVALVESDQPFSILAHIDYPLRTWPAQAAGPFSAADFEPEFRDALHALARSGRALEVNTRLPLDPQILRWWHDAGGDAISFGSDAHHPDALAAGFDDATHLAEATGFRPGRSLTDLWGRA